MPTKVGSYSAAVMKTDGSVVDVETSNKLTLAEMQAHVGGFIEMVHPQGRFLKDLRAQGYRDIVANEEGLIDQLPFNPRASILVGMNLVGDVLFLKYQMS